MSTPDRNPPNITKQYTCMKCLHKGIPKRYWKGGNYMIWYSGCAECGSGVFIQ